MKDVGVTKRVLRIHREQPGLDTAELAAAAKTSPAFVRAVKRRHDLIIYPSSPSRISLHAWAAHRACEGISTEALEAGVVAEMIAFLRRGTPTDGRPGVAALAILAKLEAK